jgi:hypothetical protein
LKSFLLAGVAQSVEQLIRNQQVSGSIPLAGSTHCILRPRASPTDTGKLLIRHLVIRKAPHCPIGAQETTDHSRVATRESTLFVGLTPCFVAYIFHLYEFIPKQCMDTVSPQMVALGCTHIDAATRKRPLGYRWRNGGIAA